MKKTFSIVSVILSIAMLLALLPIMGMSVSAGGDLYAGKGSFDTDTVADMFEEDAVTDNLPFTYAGDVTGPDGELGVASMNLFQGHHYTKPVPVESGKKYTIRFKVQLNDADAATALGLYFYINDSVYEMSNMNPLATSFNYKGLANESLGNGWYQVTATYQVSEDATTLKVSLNPRTTWAEGDSVYVDDITIAEHEHNDTTGDHRCDTPYMLRDPSAAYSFPWTTGNSFAACGETLSLPENGDMLYGAGSFDANTVSSVFGDSYFTYDNTVGYNGTGSAKRVLAETNFVTFSNTIESGKLYDLNFKIKGTGTGAIMFLRGNNANTIRILHMAILGANGAPSTYSTAIGETGWNQVSLTFSMPATSFDIQFTGLTSGGTIWIDDLTLAEHKHVANDNYVCGKTAIRNDGDSTGAPADSAPCGADMTAFAGAQGVLSEDVRLDLYVGTALTSGLTVELDADDFADNIAQREDLSLDVVDGKVSIKFPAKNMADEFTATLKNGDAVVDTLTYSVKEYAETVIATGNDTAKAAAKAMLNYGAAAQVEFGYNTDTLANAGLDAADRAFSADDIVGVAGEEIDLTNLAKNPDFEGTGGIHGYGTTHEIVDSGSAAHGKVFHIYQGNKGVLLNGPMTAGVPYYATFQLKSVTEAGGTTDGSFNFERLGIVGSTSSYSPYQAIGAVKGSTPDADGYYTYTAKFTLSQDFATPVLCFQKTTTSHVYIDNVVVRRQTQEEINEKPNVFTSIKNNWAGGAATLTTETDPTYGLVYKLTGKGTATTNNVHVNANETGGVTYTFTADVRLTDNANEQAVKFFFYDGVQGNGSQVIQGASDGWTKLTFEYTANATGNGLLLQLNGLGTTDTIELANVSIKEKTEVTEEPDPIDSYLATSTKSDGYAAFKGYTLILRDKTAVRMYFSEEVTACDAAGYTTGENAGGYYVELPSVKATALDAASTVTVTTATGSVTLENFSALAPAALVVKANSDADLANLCTALILYAEAVNALA